MRNYPNTYSEAEKVEIDNRFNHLLDVWQTRKAEADIEEVTKAFELAVFAHREQRRKTGEPYIYHPLAVATILAEDLGVGRTSIICGLLHDVVEDTEYGLDYISEHFGEKVARIVDGVTKLNNADFTSDADSIQAENFRKIVSSMSGEMRVILVKLADRLHNMRTLDAMPHHKQLKIASETSFVYAPLAYRLGLYTVKTELEDLSLKYINPLIFDSIKKQLDLMREAKMNEMRDFAKPVEEALKARNIKARVRIIERHVCGIWERMKKYQQSVQEIYDNYVVRIILDCPVEDEKVECWKTYAVLTSIYRPNSMRLRDWVSFPKSNGYESIHAIMMNTDGQWIEVQIRTERMEKIAEHGYIAYWKGKQSEESGFDIWLDRIKKLVEGDSPSAVEFLNNFKMDLFNDEIFVFTPQGKIVTLPKGSTVLDFAYTIHSDLGNHCIGANVNGQLAKIDRVLNMGEQVEVITSDFQIPKEKWFDFIMTSVAKSRLRNGIKDYRKTFRDKGKEMLRKIFDDMHIDFTKANRNALVEQRRLQNRTDLYYLVAIGKLTKHDIEHIFKPVNSVSGTVLKYLTFGLVKPSKEKIDKAAEERRNFTVSDCCHPIPGDDVVAITFPNQPIQIHRPDCPEAIKLMSRYGDHIVKAKWQFEGDFDFMAKLKIISVDKMGLGTKLLQTITDELKLNIQSISMKTEGGMVETMLSVYVNNLDTLDQLIKNIKKIDLVKKVIRVEGN